MLASHVKVARRELLGLTQRELAALLDIEPVNVSRWERGVAEPRLQHIRRLADLTGKPVSWFFEEAAA